MATAIKKYHLEIAGNTSPQGGSSFWMKAPKKLDTDILASRLIKNGVLIEPGKNFLPLLTNQKITFAWPFHQ